MRRPSRRLLGRIADVAIPWGVVAVVLTLAWIGLTFAAGGALLRRRDVE
jgi:hypothetical protein